MIPVNYISNPTIKSGTRGFNTYLNTAQPRPVNGTGAGASVTLAANTVTPLADGVELQLIKDAVNRQGQGFSTNFRINRSDLSKPLQIQFDYRLVSGTFSGSVAPATDSDVIVYIYDVDNNALIEPAGRLLEPAITGQTYRYRGTFQPSATGLNYRLIFHIATTSASAYTLAFDNIDVGPQVVSNGAVITDWQSFTPTGGFTTNTTYTGRFRRVGDSVELQYKISFSGAPNASNILLNLPSGMVIDTTKLPTAAFVDAVFGDVTLLDTSASAYFQGSAKYNNSTQLLCTVQASATGQLTAMNQAAPVTLASGDTVSVNARVPVVGWSSNVQLGSDTDTRVVAAQIPFAATAVNNTYTDLAFGAATFDTHAATSGTVYTVPVTGYYKVNALLTFQSRAYTAGQRISLRVNVNNSDSNIISYQFLPAYTGNAAVMGSTTIFVRAGDTIKVRAQNEAGTTNILVSSIESYAVIERISGPAQIAASESVNLRYISFAGQAIAGDNSNVVIQYPTRVYDSHNAWSTVNNRLTVPVSGKYSVKALIFFSSTNWNSGNRVFTAVRINGAIASVLGFVWIQNTTTLELCVYGTTTIDVRAGDTVDIVALSNFGSNKSLSTSGLASELSIERVGN